jgi:rhodanese-related sulfurtransferase
MQRLLEYIGNHYYLAGAALLAALGVVAVELKERLSGFAALSAAQAVRLMNQGALVLDLRSKEAFEAGHIGDARNIPASELESSVDSLKKWRDRAVITYCDSGVSAGSAVRTLTKLGFTKVFNLEGGVNAWIKDNMPLTKGSSGKSGAK